MVWSHVSGGFTPALACVGPRSTEAGSENYFHVPSIVYTSLRLPSAAMATTSTTNRDAAGRHAELEDFRCGVSAVCLEVAEGLLAAERREMEESGGDPGWLAMGRTLFVCGLEEAKQEEEGGRGQSTTTTNRTSGNRTSSSSSSDDTEGGAREMEEMIRACWEEALHQTFFSSPPR